MQPGTHSHTETGHHLEAICEAPTDLTEARPAPRSRGTATQPKRPASAGRRRGGPTARPARCTLDRLHKGHGGVQPGVRVRGVEEEHPRAGAPEDEEHAAEGLPRLVPL